MGRAEILLCVILQPELLEHLNIVLNSLLYAQGSPNAWYSEEINFI